MRRHAVHRTMVLVDVEGFGAPVRTLPHQLGTRAALYAVVGAALAAAGVPWDDCYHEDRGDSVFVLVPPEHPKAPLVEVLPEALARAVREHNNAGPDAARARLRLAVHAGEVAFDEHGVTSTALTTGFRLLDAAPLKKALADSPGVVAMIVSRLVFDEVVRHCATVDAATFRPVEVTVKEHRDLAWIALPDHPYHPDHAVLAENRALPGIAPGEPVPRQLGSAPAEFVGRAEEFAALDRVLAAAGSPGWDGGHDTGATAVISAIGGTGGIGKTWLALTWAHRNLHRFPDGQLAVDLRGFSSGEPRHPADALADFLAALGVDRDHQPTDLDARVALYRTHTTGKRMLILLDNAAAPDQVVPLLPGGTTCTVLITSRDRLRGLIARHSARPVHLDVLADTEARVLLDTALGDTRAGTGAERALTELIGLCGGFPLALGLIAARIRDQPELLEDLVGELRDLGLDALDFADPAASLPTVLSWSLRHLTETQRTLFGLLGVAPGPDTTLPAVVSLTTLSPALARKAMTALEEASLIQRRPHGRYVMHDLVRDYAAATAHDLPGDVRDAALVRVMDFHLHTAHAADRLLEPQRQLLPADPPAPGVQPHSLPDAAAAMVWLEAEHATLLATQRTAVALGRHHVVWHLARALDTFHLRRGHRHDALATWRAALGAAGGLPDPATRIRAHRHLGRAYSRLGVHEEAAAHLDQALSLAVHHHDRTQQAHTHQALATTWERRGDDRRGLDHARQALDLYRTLDHATWEADMLNGVGWYSARLGDFDTARDHCRAALALHRELRNATGEAATLDSLGFIAHRTGDHRLAVDRYQQALALRRALGDAYEVAGTLEGAGHSHAALGQHEQAREVWREAVALYRGQGRDTDAERVQEQLGNLDG
ncbi:tetratricopeptide repeat protein [Saccharothrix sp. AJ9571]|nr:tetratricopeptide repeat protein [Saccharothrix sp. AJ9571]